ncbi:hypothetical protein BsWGS_18495 [Bradybaena similaris]
MNKNGSTTFCTTRHVIDFCDKRELSVIFGNFRYSTSLWLTFSDKQDSASTFFNKYRLQPTAFRKTT